MSLSSQEQAKFHRQGYLLKTGLFTPEDLKPLQLSLIHI